MSPITPVRGLARRRWGEISSRIRADSCFLRADHDGPDQMTNTEVDQVKRQLQGTAATNPETSRWCFTAAVNFPYSADVTSDAAPSPDDAADGTGLAAEAVPDSDDAVRRLAEAVARLSNDPAWFLRALEEVILAMTPMSLERRTEQEESFLIESGRFTAEELAEAQTYVDRGSLQLTIAEGFLSNLRATLSLAEVTGYLDLDDEAVRTAVADGRLYAVEISGRLRFPAWQFNVGSPEKLIPGLTEVIEVVTPRWDWQSVAGFMATPQSALVAEGRKTPVAWLRDGGEVETVKQIVESADWW